MSAPSDATRASMSPICPSLYGKVPSAASTTPGFAGSAARLYGLSLPEEAR